MRRMQTVPSAGIRIADRVRDAVAAGRPVLALESTILTHGLPRPRNLEVGVETEALVRDAGVEPATIGVVDGVPTVGLDTSEIERLCGDQGVDYWLFDTSMPLDYALFAFLSRRQFLTRNR